ncbi:MAG TPA: hypothetical protein VKH19_15175 [Gemmatimonadaceae bacterium]|nr:hypothetical protein [Gemmatimonadaceae bacterium]
MATRTARSLRHEYAVFIEQEIENYKESIPRPAILAIGDEAAARLASEAQFVLTEMLMLEEVDRIIFRRLRLPTYNTWRRRRLKLHDEMRRPEHWGLTRSDAVVRAMSDAGESTGNVLVAGEVTGRSALFFAANGCDVTSLEAEESDVQRVMDAAIHAGLAARVHAVATELADFTPDAPLHAVVCSHAALFSLTPRERARVLAVLQSATSDGGVHLVETIAAGSAAIEELRTTYRDWLVSVEPDGDDAKAFLARKEQRVSH